MEWRPIQHYLPKDLLYNHKTNSYNSPLFSSLYHPRDANNSCFHSTRHSQRKKFFLGGREGGGSPCYFPCLIMSLGRWIGLSRAAREPLWPVCGLMIAISMGVGTMVAEMGSLTEGRGVYVVMSTSFVCCAFRSPWTLPTDWLRPISQDYTLANA